MTYIQPLITAAFATYPVSPMGYGGRSVDRVNDSEVDPTAFLGALTEAEAAKNIAPTSGIDKVYETDSVRGGEKNADAVSDRDAGKPRSASGDVLDLSQEAKDVWEARTQRNADVESAKADAAEQENRDDRISLNTALNAEGATGTNTSGTNASETTESLETGARELTPEEEQQVEELKARDAEVRLHEQTHVSAGGPYVTSGPSYTYQTGPDGKKYAIGGEVGIDTSAIPGDPEATIQKMQTVARAATAPAEPSSQDYKVAAAARQKEAQARAELNQRKTEEANVASEETAATVSTGLNEASEMQASQTQATEPSSKSASASNLSRSASAYQAQNTMSLGSATASRFTAYA